MAVIKWIAGIASSVAIVAVLACFSMWDDVRALKQWKAEQWPLEKQIILMENEQTKNRIAILEAELKVKQEGALLAHDAK